MAFESHSLANVKAEDVDTGTPFSTATQHMIAVESEYFVFESMVRPDHVVVIHLRNLTRNFQNKKMMDYLAKYIRDNVGGFKSFKADFIGAVSTMDKAQRLDSLDIFISGYAPALMHDERFVVRHLTDLGNKLIAHLRAKF